MGAFSDSAAPGFASLTAAASPVVLASAGRAQLCTNLGPCRFSSCSQSPSDRDLGLLAPFPSFLLLSQAALGASLTLAETPPFCRNDAFHGFVEVLLMRGVPSGLPCVMFKGP